MGPNAELSQTQLTLKLAKRLALLCRAKEHELHAINPQVMSWYDDKALVIFYRSPRLELSLELTSLLRFWDIKSPITLILSGVYKVTWTWLLVSMNLENRGLTYFWVLHNLIMLQKLVRLLRQLKIVMADTGIDISKFKAHSIRAAAVSNVPRSA